MINTNTTISEQFGTKFEFNTLQLILRDETFLKEFSSFLKEKYYSSAYTRNIFTICIAFYNTFKRQPNKDEIISKLTSQFWDDDQKELLDKHKLLVDKIYNDELPDPAVVRNNLQGFVEKAEMSILLYNAVQNFDKFSLDQLRDEVNKISRIRAVNDQRGIDLKDFFTTLLMRDDGVQGIPTTFSQIDRAVRGGLRAGELMVVMGPTNGGKSQVLVNIGRGMLVGGANVLHITIGDMSAEDTIARYVASMTNSLTKDLDDFSTANEVKKMLKAFEIFTDKNMKVQFFNGYEATVADIHGYIERLKHMYDFKTDVVIIDYADLLKPSDSKVDKRHQLSDIYIKLREMGMVLGIPVVTASQTNRQGAMVDFKSNKQILGNKPNPLSITHVAEDWGKAMTADYMFSLRRAVNYSKLDPGEQIMMVDTVKNRNGPKNTTFYFKVDFSRCRIDEIDINRKEFHEEVESRPTVDDVLE